MAEVKEYHTAHGFEQLHPRVEMTEPQCERCHHGATAHTLMGTGTCSGSETCGCKAFRFPKPRT